jgi:hypothetical protein
MHLRFQHLLAILILTAGCNATPTTSPDESAGLTVAPEYPHRGIIHWRPIRDWDSGTIEQAARADMIVFTLKDCMSESGREKIQTLKALNPNIQVLGYQSLLNVVMLWPDTAYLRTTVPYELDYYYSVRYDWAYTTTGDTIMTWQKTIFLNPFENGQLKRSLITRTVNLIDRYRSQYGNLVDGVMHDYFLTNVYINPNVADQVNGEFDLDGNGIIIEEDENERALLYQWQLEYARAFRERFGADFIQIGNGKPPQDDPGLAGLLNGIFYEHFPGNPWRLSALEGMNQLMDNHQDGYLSKAKGRTWSIVSNATYETSNRFCQYASMVAGCFYAELYGGYRFDGWHLDLNSGAPVGAPVVETGPGNFTIIRRMFENGEIYLSFDEYGRRDQQSFIPIISD